MAGLTTLLQARVTLWNYGSNVAYATSTADEKLAFDGRLNQVTDRLIGRGNWHRCFRTVRIPVFNGIITLPRECATILGCDILGQEDEDCGLPLLIYSRFYEYQVGTYGKVDRAWGLRGIVPFTDTAQTFKTPSDTFKLKATGSDVANLSLIGGTDQDYAQLFTTTLLAIGSTTTQQYDTLPRLVKPATTGSVNLYSVDVATSVETLIAVYAPGETVPAYKAYKVPGLACETPQRYVQAYCEIAHVPAVADTDIVNPGNIGALKLGLKALQYEDKSDDRDEKQWVMSERILDSERAQDDTDTMMTISFSSQFGAGNVPSLYGYGF